MGSSTRTFLLEILKREGPRDAASLARLIGITRAAVGLQLASLQREKLVSQRPAPREPLRRGRPVRAWGLTEKAQAVFPDTHAPLSAALFAALTGTPGLSELSKFLRARARAQVAQYRVLLAKAANLREKVRALARARDAEGYMADVRRGPAGSIDLVENHCPICAAARACPDQALCQSELKVFQAVLGPEAIVRRKEHILSGGRRCVYSIQTKAGGAG